MLDKNTQELLERCADVLAYSTVLLRRIKDGQVVAGHTIDSALTVAEDLFQDLFVVSQNLELPKAATNA